MTNLELFNILLKATTVEQVFGNLGKSKGEQKDNLDKKFREFARLCHPDSPINKRVRDRASEAFISFQDWYNIAVNKIAMANYGSNEPQHTTIISSRTNNYSLSKPLEEGDLSIVYLAKDKNKKDVIVKVVRNPANNDLIINEATKLSFLKNEGPTKDLTVIQHIPTLLETFEVNHGGVNKQVNVFEHFSNLTTLDSVIKAYPNGIDVRDMAWMFNRILGAMLVCHQADIIHGAITPKHILLNLETHNAILIDWCYSVKAGNPVKVIAPEYKTYYPPEVFAKIGVGAVTDIYMAGMCIIKLVGGNIENKTLNPNIPKEIAGLLRYCVLSSPKQRPNDAYELYEDFSKILEKLYGERKFRVFKMP